MSDRWNGKFGVEYTTRNDVDYSQRGAFWEYVSRKWQFGRILEVGCNTGMNVALLGKYVIDETRVWGVDVNAHALEVAKKRFPNYQFAFASGYDLPFKDEYFDLVFTAGVLIHQMPAQVETLMQEVIRCSSKYVISMEYENDYFIEVPYRGEKAALFKGPYTAIYKDRYGLKLIESRHVGKEEGFDEVEFSIFTRR